MKLTFATKDDSKEVVNFLEKYIKKSEFTEFNYELFCPYWIRWAILRDEVIILKDNNGVVWALRFYPRKRDNIVSVYQFAIEKDMRWKWLIKRMLKFTWYDFFQSEVPVSSYINDYFKKQNWELIQTKGNFNTWQIKI
jgi:hypothetical protein